MSIKDIQAQTNKNIQEKANLIWNIADVLRGLYKPHEYGKVILPFTILKRFDDALKDTKQAVVDMNNKLVSQKVESAVKEGILTKTAKHSFYNTSRFDFEKLIADSDNLEANFEAYLQGFSANVLDILANFKFADEVKTLVKGNVLFTILTEFNTKKADMSPEKISSQDMGYVFEELIRKFSESYDEQAGAHFTSRDVIYLMTELLVLPERDEIKANGCTKTAYDMAMGTSQMLGCLTEKAKDINENSDITCFGQEFNPETYAIAKSDMLIKEGNASGMKYGDTLSDDQFTGYTFDYIISNPPFGIDWKKEEKEVKKEFELGEQGRFAPGLPKISDGQLLFMLNGLKKLKETGRMTIIQNGSSLFIGDNGSVAIRKYIISNDYLEAIVQLPSDLFYNTGISTYIWVITKNKSKERLGKVQLIDASNCFVKRRKTIGLKRVDLDDSCIELIKKAYLSFADCVLESDSIKVESKVFDNNYFGYTNVTIETALTDESGNPILKKGKIVFDKEKTDNECIPLLEDIDTYFNNKIKKYNANAYLDRSKDKVGYEVPFSKIFYKYVEPKSSESILSDILKMEDEEKQLMEGLR